MKWSSQNLARNVVYPISRLDGYGAREKLHACQSEGQVDAVADFRTDSLNLHWSL
jgi:hypothetical protein